MIIILITGIMASALFVNYQNNKEISPSEYTSILEMSAIHYKEIDPLVKEAMLDKKVTNGELQDMFKKFFEITEKEELKKGLKSKEELKK